MEPFLDKTKGIGSFFSSIDRNDTVFLNEKTNFDPTNKILFYTGRQAIKYVVELIKLNQDTFTIWLPDYYCMHVTKWLKNNYSNIKTYKTNPSEPGFEVNADKFASEGDAVIINNFWGISKCKIFKGTKNITVIEDHSHGWLSPTCIDSDADYCIVSLRKSLPIPLGGMAWSPKNHKIAGNVSLESTNFYETTWKCILKGMDLKYDYEISGDISLKENSLSLIGKAELDLHNNNSLVTMNNEHKKTINDFLNINYTIFKFKNIKQLAEHILPNKNFNFITSNLFGAFGAILFFKDLDYLNTFKKYLISKSIYPSLLWPNNEPSYGYYLNIHIDYRYGKDDMLYVAKTINRFTLNNP